MKILLIGNPNVGKSAIFSKLTGVNVMQSNYPGTTVSFTKGYLTFFDRHNCSDCTNCNSCSKSNNYKSLEIIDVPGTYTLNPSCEAERIAANMIEEGDILVNVIDSTNLEKNLILTLDLLKYNKPVILVLNMWDEAKHKGIKVNSSELSNILGIPVVNTSGLSGYGIDSLSNTIIENLDSYRDGVSFENKWIKIGEIIEKTQDLNSRKHTFLEKIQDVTIHPVWGVPTAILTILLLFTVVISAGEYLISIFEVVFDKVYTPFILTISNILQDYELLHYILIGNINGAAIDYETAMGVLTTGIFMIFSVVLPYLIVFFTVLGFLEDLGYLPRIAIIFDRFFHNIGLHGFSIIPMVLSFGCNVPGLLATKNLESKKEKFITAVLISISIPCMPQVAVIFSIVAKEGIIPVLFVIGAIFSIWLMLGSTLKYYTKGIDTNLLIEIPPYRMPGIKKQIKLLSIRLKGFLAEAAPYVIGGIFVINLLNYFKIIEFMGNLIKPILSGLLGLPSQTISSFLIGILRKDAGVVLLQSMNLSLPQLLIGVILLIIYFPCIATFVILFKELKIIDGLKAVLITFFITIASGTLLNILLIKLNIDLTIMLFLIVIFAIIYSYILNKLYLKNIKNIVDKEQVF